MSLFRHVLDDRLDLLCCLFLGLLAFEFEVNFNDGLLRGIMIDQRNSQYG